MILVIKPFLSLFQLIHKLKNIFIFHFLLGLGFITSKISKLCALISAAVYTSHKNIYWGNINIDPGYQISLTEKYPLPNPNTYYN